MAGSLNLFPVGRDSDRKEKLSPEPPLIAGVALLDLASPIKLGEVGGGA